ncbi:hypothetical protein [Butyricicoccus sp.]
MDLLSFSLYGNTVQLKLRLLAQAPVALPRLLAQAPVALPRRFAKILCSDFGFGSLREFRPRCRDFLQYGKYCCETAPHQYAKFTHKSLLFNYSVLP